MVNPLLVHLARGRFLFLKPTPEEIHRVVPDLDRVLPMPQQIVLEDEAATPLVGFPVLENERSLALVEALGQYLDAEEAVQVAYLRREAFDSRAYAAMWQRYGGLLAQAIENTTVSNHGQNFPSIFWLHHSMAIARRLKDVPKRTVRRDLEIGRQHGDAIKYKIFLRLFERITDLTYDVVQKVAAKIDREEDSLFPRLLTQLHDNVLLLTEDYISSDLAELGSYFAGHLHLDGRDLRQRLTATEQWHREQLTHDPVLRNALGSLVSLDPDAEATAAAALRHSGYVGFLSHLPSYDPEVLLSREQVEVWERLLVKLKEFEVLHAMRRMMVPLTRQDDGVLVSRDRSANTTWVGGPPVLRVSHSTRPIDFMTRWVVDPVVHRYGLVYDISEFTTTLTMLGRSEPAVLDRAFQSIFRFQRRVNQLAKAHNLTLEKYLGDGAFFSSRRARQVLVVAIRLQRIYEEAVSEGLPFDRGLRIAMNHGQYRLLPLEVGDGGRYEARYEFFGHGLVELTRLATGKAQQAVDDFRTYLVSQGYPEASVNQFFAPILRRSAELGSPQEERRRFFAYINVNDTLINEGIVATEDLVSRLGAFGKMYLGVEDQRRYIVVQLADDGGSLFVGLRKLGLGRFKGLGKISVYEVVDATNWPRDQFHAVPQQSLMSALKRLFAATVSAMQKQRAAKRSASAGRDSAPTQPSNPPTGSRRE